MEDGSGKVARASRKTDVYAFSITAWEVLAGQRPFEQLGAEGRVMMEVLKGERPSLNSLPIGTPPHIKQMIVDCWSKDRQQRWTAQECFVALNLEYNRLASKEFDIFFSHRWPSKPFLSHVHKLLCEHGYKVWYDLDHMGHDLNKSMEEGVEKSTVVLAFVDAEYLQRPNCMRELLHAHKVVTEGKHRTKTIIGVLMEDGISWGANWGAEELKDIPPLTGLLASRTDFDPTIKMLDILPSNKMYVKYHSLLKLQWEAPVPPPASQGRATPDPNNPLGVTEVEIPTPETLNTLRNHDETALLFKLLRMEIDDTTIVGP